MAAEVAGLVRSAARPEPGSDRDLVVCDVDTQTHQRHSHRCAAPRPAVRELLLVELRNLGLSEDLVGEFDTFARNAAMSLRARVAAASGDCRDVPSADCF